MLLGSLDLNKVGKRLRKLDEFIMRLFGARLSHGGLSDYVAEIKRRDEKSKDGIFDKRRQEVEDERIARVKKWAIENGIDPNFAASIMYQTISESCRVQDGLMVANHKNGAEKIDESNPNIVYAYQRNDLLRLAAAVAKTYDEHYTKDFFGSKVCADFEREMIHSLIPSLDYKSLAIDLGCATGIITFDIAPNFEKVIGFDISPQMIEVAEEKAVPNHKNVAFINTDIEEGLDLPDNSVSLAIMNMGTASDIKNIDKVLECLHKCLAKDGKFLLSFYNSKGLLAKAGFIPWPMPLAAHIDPDKECLEVYHNKEVYFLYARPRSVEEVSSLLSSHGFEVDELHTFPTCSSILPGIIFEDEEDDGSKTPRKDMRKLVKKLDYALSKSELHPGTYIIVTGSKI